MARCARCGRKVDKPSRSVEAGEIVCPTCRPPVQRQLNQRSDAQREERRPRGEAPVAVAEPAQAAMAPGVTVTVEGPSPAEAAPAEAAPAEASPSEPAPAEVAPAASAPAEAAPIAAEGEPQAV